MATQRLTRDEFDEMLNSAPWGTVLKVQFIIDQRPTTTPKSAICGDLVGNSFADDDEAMQFVVEL